MSESLEALSAERRALVVHLPPTHPPTHPPTYRRHGGGDQRLQVLLHPQITQGRRQPQRLVTHPPTHPPTHLLIHPLLHLVHHPQHPPTHPPVGFLGTVAQLKFTAKNGVVCSANRPVVVKVGGWVGGWVHEESLLLCVSVCVCSLFFYPPIHPPTHPPHPIQFTEPYKFQGHFEFRELKKK